MSALSLEAQQPPAAVELTAVPPRALPQQLERLHRDYLVFVWRSLLRLGVARQNLDDAVQDVFIVAIRNGARFRGQCSYRTWLFGIATNVAHEHRRRQRRTLQLEPLPEEKPASTVTPLDHLSRAEAVALIDAFLGRLNDAQRSVFILAELEEMPATEIAQALGVKLNTVYSRLRAARQALVSMMRRQFAGEP